MKTCHCLESVKTLATTGKWEGDSCECCKKVSPLALAIGLGAVGILLAVMVFRRK
jgi:hypothetical protein